jgi:tetratricopeptide (TPR) repeat protein
MSEPGVIHSEDPEGAELLRMSEEFDATGQFKPPETDGETETETPESPEPEKPETPPETEQPEEQAELKPAADRDEKGRFKPREAAEGEPTQPVEAKRPETPYSKAQKDQQRREKTWQQIEAEKAEISAAKERVSREAQAIEAAKAQQFLQNLPRAQKDGFTADDYFKASQSFAASAQKAEQEGDTEQATAEYKKAFQANAAAQELVAYEQQYYQQTVQQQQQIALDYAFTESFQQAAKQYPEALQQGTPLYNEVQEITKIAPWIYYVPNGGWYAVEIGKMRLDVKENAALRARVAELEAKDAEREKRSQPLRGGPTHGPGKSTSSDDMTNEEFGSWLEKQAELADAQY